MHPTSKATIATPSTTKNHKAAVDAVAHPFAKSKNIYEVMMENEIA